MYDRNKTAVYKHNKMDTCLQCMDFEELSFPNFGSLLSIRMIRFLRGLHFCACSKEMLMIKDAVTEQHYTNVSEWYSHAHFSVFKLFYKIIRIISDR